MEMIISLFFFALASVVCVQLYSNAHALSKSAEESTHSVGILSNLGEAWYAAEGDYVETLSLFQKTQTVFPEASKALAEITNDYTNVQTEVSASTNASTSSDSSEVTHTQDPYSVPVHLYFDKSWNLIAADHSSETTIVSRVAHVLELTVDPDISADSAERSDGVIRSLDARMYEFKNAKAGLSFIQSQEFLCYRQKGGTR